MLKAMSTMGKGSKAWFKINKAYLNEDKHLSATSEICTYVYIVIDDVRIKMTDTMELSDRRDLYKQNK
jgi:hypothetical protein